MVSTLRYISSEDTSTGHPEWGVIFNWFPIAFKLLGPNLYLVVGRYIVTCTAVTLSQISLGCFFLICEKFNQETKFEIPCFLSCPHFTTCHPISFSPLTGSNWCTSQPALISSLAEHTGRQLTECRSLMYRETFWLHSLKCNLAVLPYLCKVSLLVAYSFLVIPTDIN